MKRSTILTTLACLTLASPTLDGPFPSQVAARVEVIEIHGCAPGWTDLGGTCWPNPLTEPSGGDGGNPSTPGELGGEPFGGGPRGGGGYKPPKPSKRPPRPRFVPTEGGQCNAATMHAGGDQVLILTRGTYTRGAGSTWYCCEAESCITCNPINQTESNCLNGWSMDE